MEHSIAFLALAVVIVVVLAFLHRAQHRLVFLPSHTRITAAEAQGVTARFGGEELTVDVDGATLHGFFLPAPGAEPPPAPTVIYFGGNAETLADSVPDLNHMRERGWNVVLPCYRGFGLSTGTPTTARVQADALAVFDRIAADPRVDADRIAIWGRSIGTGVTCHVASHRTIAGAILACPFALLSDVAKHLYPWLPVGRFFTQEMDSLAHAREAGIPALLLHGDVDTIVPVEQAQLLAATWSPPARLIIFEGRGHNDLAQEPAYYQETEAFLQTVFA